MNTMLSSSVPIIRAIDITADVVGSRVYSNILREVADKVKSALSVAFEKHPNEIPGIMVQMILVGKKQARRNILKTLTGFYKREVDDSIDTLVGLIEPVMIVVLGLG